jgi:hypothetical protein
MQRRLLLVSVPLAAALVNIGGIEMLPASPGVTKATFDRILDGMTVADVEAIMGGPGGFEGRSGRPIDRNNISYYWLGDRCSYRSGSRKVVSLKCSG